MYLWDNGFHDNREDEHPKGTGLFGVLHHKLLTLPERLLQGDINMAIWSGGLQVSLRRWYTVFLQPDTTQLGASSKINTTLSNSSRSQYTWHTNVSTIIPTDAHWAISRAVHVLRIASRVMAGLRGCVYYNKRQSGLAVSPTCTLFSHCCYVLPSQQNKCHPQTVATLKRTAKRNSNRGIWLKKHSTWEYMRENMREYMCKY